MRRDDEQLGTPQVLYKNTKAVIEAITPSRTGAIAFATDTGEFGFYNGASWIWIISQGLTNPVDVLEFNTGYIETGDESEGSIFWDSEDGGLKTPLAGGNVKLNHGFEVLVPRRCKNNSGVDIKNGNLVYISGGDGTNAYISLADYSLEATSAVVIGMATEDIDDGSLGWVTTYGLVRGDAIQPIDTSIGSAGDTLYLGASGTFTTTKPLAPYHLVIIGTIFRSHASEGIVLVHIANGFEIEELHDVDAFNAVEYDALYKNGAGLWEASASFLQGTQGHSAGWLDRDITPTITVASGTFSYTLTGDSVYYVDGKRYEVTNFSSGARVMTKGNRYFFYVDTENNQQWSTTPWDISALSAPTALVYYYDDTHYIPVEERHASRRNPHHHREFHFTQGCYWTANDGLSISSYTLDSTSAGDWKWALESGIIRDEDIASPISAWASGSYNVMYRELTTGYWYWDAAVAIPFKVGAGGRVTYNNPTGWTQAEAGVGQCVNYYICAFPSLNQSTQIFVIQGQQVYANEAAAVAATIATDVAWSTLPSEEIKPLYQMTVQAGASGDKNALVNMKDIRASSQVLQINSAASITSHNSLSGLQGGGVGEYFHLISSQYSDLTSSGSSTSHYHLSDRLRSNHSGTQSEASLAFTDVTTNDATIARHGFLPKLPNDATKYLNGLGQWTTPSGTSGGGGITENWAYVSGTATPYINTDEHEFFFIKNLDQDITSLSANLTGTPYNFQRLTTVFLDNGISKNISYGTKFESGGVDFITSTTPGAPLIERWLYSTERERWLCIYAGNGVSEITTLTLQPDETDGIDTFLSSTSAALNFGTDVSFLVGESNSAATIARTLIKFSGISAIPQNAVIISATLSLTISLDRSSNTRDFKVYRSLKNWGELTTTWNTVDGSNAWSTAGSGGAGTDYDSTVWSTVSFTASEVIDSVKDFVLDTAEFTKLIDGTYANNYGWMIKADTENNDQYSFHSSNAATASFRPKLVVEYM